MLSLITKVTTPKWLPFLHQLLCDQSVQEWQWLIVGLGPYLKDHRIKHCFTYEEALKLACGDTIVHVDENTYYAPSYLEQTMYHLQDVGQCLIGAWFGYDMTTKQGIYWSSFEPQWSNSKIDYSLLDRVSDIKVREINYELISSPQMKEQCDFTFCCRKKKQEGQKVLSDQWGSIVRLIHDPKVLYDAPYFRLPSFIFEQHLPRFMDYLARREQSQL